MVVQIDSTSVHHKWQMTLYDMKEKTNQVKRWIKRTYKRTKWEIEETCPHVDLFIEGTRNSVVWRKNLIIRDQ